LPVPESAVPSRMSPALATSVSIIVPTFNRTDTMGETLDALRKLTYPAELLEVIVIDDSGGSEAAAVARKIAGNDFPIRCVSQPNRGVASARNAGARLAKGELLIFLDDDMLVEPTHVEQHLATHEAFDNCIVNGHWEFAPEIEKALADTPFGRFRIWVESWVKDGIAKQQLDATRLSVEGVTACNLSIYRDDFWKVGGFDETFPYAGYEDQEFSFRASQGSYRFIYDTELRLLHNDRRMTLAQFGRRQAQGAMTAVLLAAKHPARYADVPLIRENSPVARGDGFRLGAKKMVKLILSTPPALRLVHAVIAVWERVWPSGPGLHRAYWATCGLYIYRGVRTGLAQLDRPLSFD
jgi:glycosyltransferase involved in cell wall biosynthesis